LINDIIKDMKEEIPAKEVAPYYPSVELEEKKVEEEPLVIEEPVLIEAPDMVPHKEEPEVAVVVAPEQIQVEEPALSDDEKLKVSYMKDMETLAQDEKKYAENLKYMMDMGYFNFKINLSLLKRNENDLVISINKLCNGIVTESMFEGK